MQRHRHQHSRVQSNNVLTSRCGEIYFRGNFKQLELRYEEMTRSAESEMEAENFRQHAEHWRRMLRGEGR